MLSRRKRRHERDVADLIDDPRFPFYVGRLIGAAEITAYWLVIQDGADAREMGRRLGAVVDWFVAEEGHNRFLIPPVGDEVTAELRAG